MNAVQRAKYYLKIICLPPYPTVLKRKRKSRLICLWNEVKNEADVLLVKNWFSLFVFPSLQNWFNCLAFIVNSNEQLIMENNNKIFHILISDRVAFLLNAAKIPSVGGSEAIHRYLKLL